MDPYPTTKNPDKLFGVKTFRPLKFLDLRNNISYKLMQASSILALKTKILTDRLPHILDEYSVEYAWDIYIKYGHRGESTQIFPYSPEYTPWTNHDNIFEILW